MWGWERVALGLEWGCYGVALGVRGDRVLTIRNLNGLGME